MEDRFGPKLEEARTRRGLSIRDAADATKIRSDFLISFEQDHGNFDMPEVYKRGFIKLYARYLKLDQDEILKDYQNYVSGASKRVKKEGREILGRIDLPGSDFSDEEEDSFLEQPSLNFEETKKKETPKATKKESFEKIKAPIASMDPETKRLYIKLGAIFGGGLAALIIIAVAVSSWMSSRKSDISSTVAQSSIMSSSAKEGQFNENLTLVSESDVRVVVRQESDKEHLFSGYLEPNKPVTISRKGPVKIHFTDGSKLSIQRQSGEKIRPGGEGRGWIEI